NQRERIRHLAEVIEQTSSCGFTNEFFETLVSIQGKVRLINREIDCQEVESSQSIDDTATCLSQNVCQQISPSQEALQLSKSLPLRRVKSLEDKMECPVGRDGFSRWQRNAIVIRVHQGFQFCHLLGQNVIRELKTNLQHKLTQQTVEVASKQTRLSVEMKTLHHELTALKGVVNLLASVPRIQHEVSAIVGWYNHELAYFRDHPIPDVLTELLNGVDGSNDDWWEGLLQGNAVLHKHLHIQSRIRRKQTILAKILELRRVLEDAEQPFQPTDLAKLDEQFGAGSVSMLHRIRAHTQATIRVSLAELLQCLDEINQEASKRYEQLLVEQIKIRDIERSFEMLQWIRRSEKCLLETKSPFLDLFAKIHTASQPLAMIEPFLVVLEKEIKFHTEESLHILQEFEVLAANNAAWSTLLEYTLNAWNELITKAKMKRLSVDTAKRLLTLNAEVSNTREWVKHKKELLLSIGEKKNTMGEMIRMECRMDGWETDLTALKERVCQVFKKMDALSTGLKELQSPLSAESWSTVAVRDAEFTLKQWKSQLHADWNEFVGLLEEYQKRLESSLAFQSMLQELEVMYTTLLSKQNTITSLELPTSIDEISEQEEVFRTLAAELEASNDKLETLVLYGRDLAAFQEKAVATAVTERLNNLKCEWSDLLILCKHQLILLRDVEALNVSLSRKENQIVQTDYLPTSEHIRGKITAQKQVLASIQALSDQVRLLQLKSNEHKVGEKYDARVLAVKARYSRSFIPSKSIFPNLAEATT
ncbi:unnamed protein product, partial [Hydatigera taeniaeformis]|uniref:DUF4455 domain-containing protein n=1 Tax=Hydatigena taeniaeformis TaxID=6205 RepID=A0A0R3WQ60_HYDTA